MHPRDQFPTLGVYFDAYLNQDWMDDYSDVDAAFAAFSTEATPTELAQALREFDRVLALQDTELRQTVDLLSSNIDPRNDLGLEERDWLTTLRDRARAELDKREGLSATGVAAY